MIEREKPTKGAGAAVIPVGMRRVYRRLERWRSMRPRPLSIPESLWSAAAKLAGEHGVCRTAQTLHLEYGKLKRLAETRGTVTNRKASPPTFVELIGSQAGGLSECIVELEGARGKMRIQWRGTTAPDLAGLTRVLLEPVVK